jgi:hypothetical protein
MAEKSRATVEVGSLVIAGVAILGLIFQAGVLWARVSSQDTRITKLEQNYQGVPERLSRIEQLVQDMHDQMMVKRP